jgi:hypothetical protein
MQFRPPSQIEHKVQEITCSYEIYIKYHKHINALMQPIKATIFLLTIGLNITVLTIELALPIIDKWSLK